MTTMDVPSFTGYLALRMAKKREARQAIAQPRIQVLIRFMMHVFGFSCLTIAGFWAHPVAGFVVAGFSWFALSYLTTNRSTTENGPMPPRLR